MLITQLKGSGSAVCNGYEQLLLAGYCYPEVPQEVPPFSVALLVTVVCNCFTVCAIVTAEGPALTYQGCVASSMQGECTRHVLCLE
jgi:hypothetical protein